MIAVKVTYTVNSEYMAANREMIKTFLADFGKLDHTQFLYTVFEVQDGTFVHLSQYKNQEIQQELLRTPSFVGFQRERDKNLSSEPKIEMLDFIGSSKALF